VLDALHLGFGVTVIRDGIAAVEVNPGDGQRAQSAMEAAGARFIPSGQTWLL
jgi:nicotinamidase-related amidase